MKANSAATLAQYVERRHGGDDRDNAADDELAPIGRVLGGDDVGNRLARQDAFEIHDPPAPLFGGNGLMGNESAKGCSGFIMQHLATGRRSLPVP